MKSYQFVKTSIKDRIGIILLNRPEKRNALNQLMVEELKMALSDFNAAKNVKVVILKGTGEAFCAGADLAYLQQLQKNTYDENLEDSENLKAVFELIYRFKKVVIAQVEGHAIAGGAGLACVCDFIFAVPEAKFGFTEVKIGFVPAIVSFFLIRKIGEAKARELLLTGKLITSNEAFNKGLINAVITSHTIEKEVEDFAIQIIQSTSGDALKITKAMIAASQHMDDSSALKYLAEVNAKARETDDCKKGIKAFLDKKKISW